MNLYKNSIISLALTSVLFAFVFVLPLYLTFSMVLTSLVVFGAIYLYRKFEIDFNYIFNFVSQLVALMLIVSAFITTLWLISGQVSIPVS